jgi:hypothetical protein
MHSQTQTGNVHYTGLTAKISRKLFAFLVLNQGTVNCVMTQLVLYGNADHVLLSLTCSSNDFDLLCSSLLKVCFWKRVVNV